MASEYNDLVKSIQGGSHEQQEQIAQAIFTALSQSDWSKLYISTVLANNHFFVEINLDKKPTVRAWYVGQENKVVFFLNHPEWELNNDSQLIRVILHEFYHAFCTILHAPDHIPQKYQGDSTVLAFPVMPKTGATIRELREVQRYLQEGHSILSMVLYRYLMGIKEFETKYPLLFQELKQCSRDYHPPYVDNYYPKTKKTCEESYPEIFEQLHQRGAAQTTVYDTAFIIYKFIGATQSGECRFLGQDGHMDWPPQLNQLFALYGEVYSLTNQWSDQKARSYYERFVPRERVEFYLATERVTHTMEIGGFIKFYNNLIKRLLKDIKENEGEMKKELSTAIEDLEQSFSSKSEIDKEISSMEYLVSTIPPEVVAKKIEEQQNAFGLKLFVALSTVPQLMGTGLSLFLDASEKMLAIAGPGTEGTPENETNSSTAIYLAAGCTAVLVGLGYYCFWRSANAKPQTNESTSAQQSLRKG